MFGSKTKGFSPSVIMMLLIVATVGGSSSNFITQNVYAGKYSPNNDQASSQAINCSGDNENCVNSNPQVQGKDNDIKTQITIPSETPGSADESRQIVVTLHDDAEGHAAGWNPPGLPGPPGPGGIPVQIFHILPPFKIEQGMSFEFTFINPLSSGPFFSTGAAGNCELFGIGHQREDGAETLDIACYNHVASIILPTPTFPPSLLSPPSEGATLTYVMTQ